MRTNITLSYFAVCIFFFLMQDSYGQVKVLCGNDTIRISLDNYQAGKIIWQESHDSIHWTSILNANDSTLVLFTNEEKFIRSGIITANCEELYAEPVYIRQIPVANAGMDRKIAGNSLLLNGNFANNAIGHWALISGGGGSLSSEDSVSAVFNGNTGEIYQLEWSLTNSCGTGRDTVSIEFIQNTYNQNFIIVDNTDNILSDSAQIAAGIYHIQFSEIVSGINDSSLLVGIVGEGFLVKTLSLVQVNDSTYIFITRRADLDELIFKGVLNLGDNLFSTGTRKKASSGTTYLETFPTRKQILTDQKFKNGTFVFEYPEEVEKQGIYKKSASDDENGFLFAFDDQLKISTEQGENKEYSLSFGIKGSFEIIPNLVFDPVFDWGLTYLKMGFDNSIIRRNFTYSISGQFELSRENKKNWTKNLQTKRQIKLIFILEAPILVVNTLECDLILNFYGSGKAAMDVVYDQTNTYSAYLLYENEQIKGVSDRSKTSSTRVENVFISGSAGIEAILEPRAKMKVFGVLGPFFSLPIKLNPELCGSYSLPDNQLAWNANITFDMDAKLGCEVGISKKLSYDLAYTSKIFETVLYIPYKTEIVAGNYQQGKAGEMLPAPLSVRVTSNLGFGVPLVPVWFEVVLNNGNLQKNVVLTDARGYANNTFKMGTLDEENVVKVSAVNCDFDDLKESPLYFHLQSPSQEVPLACQNTSLFIGFNISEGQMVTPYGKLGSPAYSYSLDGKSFNQLPPSISLQNAAGTTFYIKDSKGCTRTNKFEYSDPCVNSSLQLVVSVRGNTVSAQGKYGVPPYLYSLYNEGSFSTTANFIIYTPGKYLLYIKDSKGCIKIMEFTIVNGTVGPGNVTDIDGNVYKTVQIGTQTWMAENLKTTKYRDGTPIPNVTDNTSWSGLTTGSYCWYDNDASTYKATYGALYNWYTVVDSRNLCPIGWHMPTDAEWTILTTFLGGEEVAGGKMKETGTTHWKAPNIGATNSSGFTGLPAGYRNGYEGLYQILGYNGSCWSSSDNNTVSAWYRDLFTNNAKAYRYSPNKLFGFSVRCLSNEVAGVVLPTLGTTQVSNITTTSARLKGVILSSGGATISELGFLYYINGAPPFPIQPLDSSEFSAFTTTLTGLQPGTTYHIRAFAANSAGKKYDDDVTFTTLSEDHVETLTDIDGNIYKTVQIGTQTWMAENLKTTKYRDGTPIPNVTDNTAWSGLTTAAYCWYNNDAATYKATYGALYNWYTVVDSRNLCPIGWHMPTDAEWTTLTTFLGGESAAGTKMKSTSGWNNNGNGTNSSGFTSLPGGNRATNGAFASIGFIGDWWSSTEYSTDNVWFRLLYDNYGNAYRVYTNKHFGFSVRCLRN